MADSQVNLASLVLFQRENAPVLDPGMRIKALYEIIVTPATPSPELSSANYYTTTSTPSKKAIFLALS